MKTFLFLLLTAMASGGFAQQGVTGAGADAQGAGGSMSYSIGQVGYTSVQGQPGTSSAGIQQPYEYLVLAVDDDAATPTNIAVAPNPTHDGVHVSFRSMDGSVQRYVLLDAAGQVVHRANITSTLLHIPMGHLPPAIYLLRMEGEDHHTFQIIKQ